MQSKTILQVITVAVLTLSLTIAPLVFVKAQPTISPLTFQHTINPTAALMATPATIDIFTQLTTPFGFSVYQDDDGLWSPGAIMTLYNAGFKITSMPGFHVAYFGVNIQRPILNDVNFRHALALALDSEMLIATNLRWTATPVQSLVPPAQGGWMAPDVLKYPFNPGTHLDPPGTESAFGILKWAGYTYHGSGYGDLTAYWTDPGGDPLPTMSIYSSPLPGDISNILVRAWVAELNRVGLNNIAHAPSAFDTYSGLVFDQHNFDIYFMSAGLGMLPDHLYDMCHSGQYVLGGKNAPGIIDPELDGYLEIVKYSLDHNAQVEACHEVQRRLSDVSYNYALAYIPFYSMACFSAEDPMLSGKIRSPGYGEYNMWTLLHMTWPWPTPGAGVTWGIPETPCSLNPCQVITSSEWAILGAIIEGLVMLNPYTLRPIPWIANDFAVEAPITETITLDSDNTYMGYAAGESVDIVDGMKVTFSLRDPPVMWQDGNPYTAFNAEFSLEFLRENQIPRYKSAWEQIVDVQVYDDYTFTVYSNITSQFLLYDWAALAAMLPPPVWSWLDGLPLPQILGYDPTTNYTDTGPWSYPDGPDGIPGTPDDPNPTHPGPKTCLLGTGPFTFDNYNAVTVTATLHSNPTYWKTTVEIDNQLAELFYYYGDIDGRGPYGPYTVQDPGWVWANDKYRWGQALLTYQGDAAYDAYADLNGDGDIDFGDGAIISAGFGETLES